jgi:hypothetical protein
MRPPAAPTIMIVGNQCSPWIGLRGNSQICFWSDKIFPGNCFKDTLRSFPNAEGAGETLGVEV